MPKDFLFNSRLYCTSGFFKKCIALSQFDTVLNWRIFSVILILYNPFIRTFIWNSNYIIVDLIRADTCQCNDCCLMLTSVKLKLPTSCSKLE